MSVVCKDVKGSRDWVPAHQSKLHNVSRITLLKESTVFYHCDPQLMSLDPQVPQNNVLCTFLWRTTQGTRQTQFLELSTLWCHVFSHLAFYALRSGAVMLSTWDSSEIAPPINLSLAVFCILLIFISAISPSLPLEKDVPELFFEGTQWIFSNIWCTNGYSVLCPLKYLRCVHSIFIHLFLCHSAAANLLSLVY